MKIKMNDPHKRHGSRQTHYVERVARERYVFRSNYGDVMHSAIVTFKGEDTRVVSFDGRHFFVPNETLLVSEIIPQKEA